MSCVTMFYSKNCRFCGQTFTPTGSRSRYCSAECKYRVKLAALTAKRHQERSPGTPTPRTCAGCGKSFRGFGPVKYCTRRCRTDAYNLRQRLAHVPAPPSIILCKRCGVSFVWPYAQRSICDACKPERAREHQRKFWAKQIAGRSRGAQ